MTFKRLKEISAPHFHCISLDKYFPRGIRGSLRKLSALFALLSFIFSFDSLPLYFGKADGMFFVSIFTYLSLSFLEFFYRSMRAEGLPVRINESIADKTKTLDYSLSEILWMTDEIDATKAFFEAKAGIEVLMRAGIPPHDAKSYAGDPQRQFVMASSLNLEGDSVSLAEYAAALYEADKSFEAFLSRNSINKAEFVGAAEWVSGMAGQKFRKERFWSRENLAAIPSIGTSWSYGQASDLGKYGVSFEHVANLSALQIENGYRKKEVSLLEGILERRSEANAIIIDDDEGVALDIIGRLLKKIKLGIAPPSLEHKNIIELDWNSLVSFYKNKAELEAEILKILNQSVAAGNIIIFIRDLAGMVSRFKSMGTSLPSLIAPYLGSNQLQTIASATNADFHFFIETNPALLERFERVIPEPAAAEASMSAVLEQVPSLEEECGLFLSYSSVLALVNAADRFIAYGEMPEKALDLLAEIAPWAAERNITLLREEDVNAFISQKTGIVTGEIKEKEAEKIEHLEELLHRRVIGQNEAIQGIASAIRRSRSGINNPKRPLASFLFMGPTGVGKTEVSKALAESFFGDEKKMIRFDMSEYNGPEALSQLIGDFALNKSGLLASKVRDNPYSVLLLDEFEKASPDVLDLFLQILDEGIFTDALGRQASCRNLIIIATSNAGSQLIWESVKAGKELSAEKEKIINEIIRNGVFRPELLNRFDSVILFHPLKKDELQSVINLGLQKLVNRLKEKDIELVVNDDVLNYLIEKGVNPESGGRGVNRAIQNEIEDYVARKIVSGEAKAGSKIEIKKEELK